MPLTANTVQGLTPSTGGLFDPINQAIVARYQGQAELAAQQKAELAAQQALQYQHEQDASVVADRAARLGMQQQELDNVSRRQLAAEKAAEIKAKAAAKKAVITVRARKALAKKKGMSLDDWTDEEIVGTTQSDFTALLKGEQPAKSVAVQASPTEFQRTETAGLLSQGASKEYANPTVQEGLSTRVANAAITLQQQVATKGGVLPYDKAVQLVAERMGITTDPEQDTWGWNNKGAYIHD